MIINDNVTAPLVSVIVPNYNYLKYLPSRMASITGQTYSNMELILLDDCSTDGSAAWLEQFARSEDLECRVIVNENNSGSPFFQWKKGIDAAKGKYIWIAEADDSAQSQFLEESVSLLERYPSASYCFTGSVIIDGEGKATSEDMDKWTRVQQNNPLHHKCFDGTDYVRYNMYWTNYVYNASGVVFRRDSFLKISGKDWSTMRYCGDWYLWTYLALVGDVVEIYKKLNRFRKHTDSVTVDSRRDDSAYAVCMKECMGLTVDIEKRLSLSLYKKILTCGHYYYMFSKMQDLQLKRELMSALETYHLPSAFSCFFYRTNKLLSKVFPLLNRIKSERCQ